MLTTLSITSLDQGREIACRQVAALTVEPSERAGAFTERAVAQQSARRSPLTHVVELLDTLRPIDLRWR